MTRLALGPGLILGILCWCVCNDADPCGLRVDLQPARGTKQHALCRASTCRLAMRHAEPTAAQRAGHQQVGRPEAAQYSGGAVYANAGVYLFDDPRPAMYAPLPRHPPRPPRLHRRQAHREAAAPHAQPAAVRPEPDPDIVVKDGRGVH